jgi:hypothetical protein
MGAAAAQAWRKFLEQPAQEPAPANPSEEALAQTPQALAQTPQALAQTPQALAQTPQALAQTPRALARAAQTAAVLKQVPRESLPAAGF